MGEDGSVVISVNMDVDDAEKELSRLQKKILKTEEALSRAKFDKNTLVKSMEEAQKELDKVQKRTTIKGGRVIIDPEDISKITELKKEISDIESEIKKCDAAIKKGNNELEYTKERYVELEQKITKIGSGGFLTGSFKRIEDMLLKIPSLAKFAFGTAKKAVSSLAKKSILAAKGILKMAINLNAFSKIANKVGPALSMLGKMIRRVFVFNVISSGLRLLRGKVGEYISTNEQLKTSLSQLKGSFLTAFNPIIKSVIPILNTLINVMTRALAVTAQFIATLFGTTVKQAKNNAEALEEQAKATSGAGKAAKEAGKDLAAFDEINKLDTSTSGGGGGGAGAGASELEDAFDFEIDTTMFDSWGEAFLWFLDQIDQGIARLKDAFGKFADWFNNLNKKIYDMFTFPDVKDKVIKIGYDLADALNFLVDSIDWYTWGKALGAGLNLGLLFLTSAIYGFDWIGLGMHLAEFVNGLVSEIDWYEFGRLLWAGFKIALEVLAGFLLGLDMPLLAEAASNVIKGFFDAATETIQKINWSGIGRQILTFFRNIDWDGVADSANNFINAFFDAVHRLITSAHIGEIAALIVNFFAKIDWAGIGYGASRLVADFLNALAEFFAKANWNEIGRKIIQFFAGIDWGAVAAALFNALGSAVGAAFDLLLGAIEEIGPAKVLLAISAAFLTIALGLPALVAELFVTIGAIITGAIAGLPAIIIAAIVAAAALIWVACEENGEYTVQGFLEGIMKIISGIGAWIKEHIFTPFINGFKKAFGISSPSTVMMEMGRYIIEGLKNGLSNLWESVKGFFTDALNNIKGTFSVENLKNIGSSMVDGLMNGVSGAAGKLKEWAGGILQSIKDKMGIASPSKETNNIGVYMVEGMLKGVSKNISAVTKQFDGMLNDIRKDCTDNVNMMTDAFIAFLSYLASDFTRTWNKTFSDMYSMAYKNIKAIMSAFDSMQSSFQRNIQSMIQSISSLQSSFSSNIQSIMRDIDALNAKLASIERNITITITTVEQDAYGFSGFSGYSGYSSYSIPNGVKLGPIPALASGTVIPPNRRFLAELGDNKQETEVVSPLSTMKQAFREAMIEAGITGNGQQEAIIYVGEDVFGRLAYKLGGRERSRIGASLVVSGG